MKIEETLHKLFHNDFTYIYGLADMKCGELAKQKLNSDIRICGICISVCPIGLKNK